MSTKLVDNIQNSDKKSKKQKVQEVTYAREFIPRAIYNDHITELLLRAEGPSGRPPKSEDIAPLKLDGAYKIQHSGGTKINPTFVKQNSKYNLVNQQQNNKTFVFTEESLEIVNLIYEVPIHPIPLKPKMQLPKPVYFQGRVTSHFMSTSRSGANQNILRLTPKKTKLQAKESVRKMMHGNAKNLEASTLRYNRVFVPLPMPLKQEIQRRRKASVAPTEMRIFEKDALIVPQEFLRESEESNAMQEENEKLALEIIAQLQLENDAESARLESSKNQQLNAQSPIMPVQVLEAEPSVPFELNLVTEVNSKESSIDVIKNDEKLPEITIPIVESLVPASPAQPVLTKEELDEEEWLRQQKSMFYSGLHVEPLFASTKETKAESKTKTSKNLEAPRKSPQSKDPSLQPIDKMRSLSIESIKSVKSIKEETQSKMQALYNDLNDIPNAEAEISQPAAVSSNFMLNQLGTKVSIEHSPEHAASYGKLLDTSKYSENSLEARKSKSRLSGMFKKKSKFLNAMDVQSMQVDEPTRTYSSANDDSDTASISSNKSNFKSKFKSSLGSVFSKKDRSLDIANDCKSMASLSESPNHESVSELEDDTASISSKKSGMGKFKSSIKSIFKNKDKRTSRSFNALDEEVKLENDEVIEAPIKIEETKPVKTIISTDELAKEFISITSLEDIESKKEGHSNESSSIIKAKGSMDSIVQIQQKTLVESLQNLNSSLNAVDKDSSRGNDTPMSGKFFTKAIQEKSSPITKSLEFKNYDTSPTDSTSSILTPKVISGSPKSLKKENVEKEHAEVLVQKVISEPKTITPIVLQPVIITQIEKKNVQLHQVLNSSQETLQLTQAQNPAQDSSMELNGTVAPSKIDFLKSNQSIHGISNSSGVNSPLVSIDHAISATSAKIQVIQSSIIQKEIVILDKLSTPIEAKQDLLVQKEDAIVKIGAIQTLPRQTEDLKSTPNPPQTAIKQDSSLIEKESIIIIDASPLVKVKPVPPIQTEAIITIDASPSFQVEQDLSIKKEAIIILEASPLVQVKPVFPIQTEAIITNDSSPSSQVEQDLSIKKEEIIILEASPLLKEKQDTVAQKESIIKVDNTSPLSQVKQDPIPRKEATINVDAIPSSQVEDKHEPPIIQKQEQVREPPIQTSQFSPQTKTNIQIKGIKLTTTIENNSINVFEPGKKTQFKHFYPLELRRIITATQKETSVTLKACITRKGNRDGSKFKKITFTFDDVSIAKEWCQGVLDLVYETNSLSFKKVIVLYDKYDGKKAFEVLEKFMKPIFDEVNKPIEFKEIKFIDFTLTNIFGSIDFNEIGNVICAGTEYSNQISQILVRNRFCNAPVLLNLERDPVDAGLAILKASVGSKAGTLFVSNINPKRDENKFTGLFKKK